MEKEKHLFVENGLWGIREQKFASFDSLYVCLFYIICWFSSLWIDGFEEENTITSGNQGVYIENYVVSRNCVGLDVNWDYRLPWLYILWTSNEISCRKLLSEYSDLNTKTFLISIAQASLCYFQRSFRNSKQKSTTY